LLTEYCEYKSLKAFSYLLENMDNNEKLRLVLDIFNGINALHEKNIMHRDLKPENILVDKNKRAKVCDYGFCIYDYE
jgi:serine/threonine protein kinase